MKIKLNLISLIFLFFFSYSFAQTDTLTSEDNPNKVHIRLYAFIPGIAIENALSKECTFFTEIGTGYGFHSEKNGNSTQLNIFYFNDPMENPGNYSGFKPFIKFQPRFYYNLERREEKGKYIRNHSGNYVSIMFLYYPDESFAFAPVWGFQRNKKEFTFNLGVGIGYSSKTEGLILLAEIKIGALLNPGNKKS